jgi:hypothetical protein
MAMREGGRVLVPWAGSFPGWNYSVAKVSPFACGDRKESRGRLRARRRRGRRNPRDHDSCEEMLPGFCTVGGKLVSQGFVTVARGEEFNPPSRPGMSGL